MVCQQTIYTKYQARFVDLDIRSKHFKLLSAANDSALNLKHFPFKITADDFVCIAADDILNIHIFHTKH